MALSTTPTRRRRPPRPGQLSDLSPPRIALQIAILQTLFYASVSILILFSALTAGKQLSPSLILGWQHLRGDVSEGYMWAIVWLLEGGVMAVAILLLIARSKLVLDFAGTIYMIHLIATTLYTGMVPRNMFWWLTMMGSVGVATGVGVWSCRWRELQPINFGGRSPRAGGGNGGEEEDAGFEMGERRGKEERGGRYEVVGNGSAG